MARLPSFTEDLGESQKSTIPRAVAHVGVLNTVVFVHSRNSLHQKIIVRAREMGAAEDGKYVP